MNQFNVEEAIELGNSGKHEEALAIATQIDSAVGHYVRAVALEKLNRDTEAIAAYRAALQKDPTQYDCISRLGILLVHNEVELVEAEKLLKCARQRRPSHWQTANSLGNLYRKTRKISDSISAFRSGIEASPNVSDLRVNLGVSLMQVGDVKAATQALRQAIRLNPASVFGHFNLSLALLTVGDFEDGWLEYEWRRHINAAAYQQKALPFPEWNGCPLGKHRLLLRSEQGLGDTFQFARYATAVRNRCGRVILECQTKLGQLLAGTDGVDEVIESGAGAPAAVNADMQVRLMSLPCLLGTRADTIPATVPYIHPPEDKVDFWRQNMVGVAGFKIGIVWQGNPKYSGDADRSIPLKFFAPLARIPGVQLFSLQKGHGEEQLRDAGFAVHIFSPELDASTGGAFIDTAGVLKNLDLLITSDTAIAHLAGAMAVPTWVALGKWPDWRWGRSGTKTPWYPTMRLFRQEKAGDWGAVFSCIRQELQQRVGACGTVDRVSIETSPGELLDRLTILKIKSERIRDDEKLKSVMTELAALQLASARSIPPSKALDGLVHQLLKVNEVLWDIEDSIRSLDQQQDFGDKFVEVAKNVYRMNDLRSKLKNQINTLLGSTIGDVKAYAEYK